MKAYFTALEMLLKRKGRLFLFRFFYVFLFSS